jgi:hypothetical protein
MSDYSDIDDLISSMGNNSQSLADMDFGGMDFGGLDLGDIDLGGMDLSGLEGMDLGGMDLSGLEGMDLGSFDLGGDNLDDILSGLGGGDVGGGFEGVNLSDSNFDDIDSIMNDKALGVGEFFDPSEPLRTPEGVDESFAKDLSDPDYERYIESLSPESQAEQERLQKIAENLNLRPGDEGVNMGKMPSGWQKSSDGSYVNIRDDGTADGIDQDGNSFALSESQVQARIKSGDLNTFKSGYNTATGGNKTAPGGGTPVTLKNGKEGQLMPNGKVIDKDTGKPIGTEKDVKTDNKPSTGGGGGGGGSKDSNLGSLLPLLLMMMMMNKDKGGGGSSAVIPALAATQRQTPYTQQQRAPGARPGQGGITYFDQTQYTPKMASGGIARLLQGPGDGVSDSIPAVITDGMSRGGQPAKVARGEYIMDARTVAALGNGSTDAGAERLDKMRQNILRDDRKAGVGKDSKAYRHLMA